jgi:hypothetical protein
MEYPTLLAAATTPQINSFRSILLINGHASLSSRRVNEGQAGILKVPDVVDGDDLVLKERLHEYRRRC